MIRSSNKDAKGFWQAIERRFSTLLPRQAIVIRSEGKGVWVRFASEETGVPESRFPTTVMGLSAGSSGWVFTLGGKKGLFVATGIATPLTDGSYGAVSATISSAGVTVFTTQQVTFSGLDPARAYTIDATATVVANSTTAGRIRIHPRVTGASASDPANAVYSDLPTNRTATSVRYRMIAYPSDSGSLVVAPATSWISGTTTIYMAAIAATVS